MASWLQAAGDHESAAVAFEEAAALFAASDACTSWGAPASNWRARSPVWAAGISPDGRPDLDTFLRGYLAAGPIVSAIRTLGEEPVRDALTEGVRPLMTASGGVRFEDEYRYLIAIS